MPSPGILRRSVTPRAMPLPSGRSMSRITHVDQTRADHPGRLRRRADRDDDVAAQRRGSVCSSIDRNSGWSSTIGDADRLAGGGTVIAPVSSADRSASGYAPEVTGRTRRTMHVPTVAAEGGGAAMTTTSPTRPPRRRARATGSPGPHRAPARDGRASRSATASAQRCRPPTSTPSTSPAGPSHRCGRGSAANVVGCRRARRHPRAHPGPPGPHVRVDGRVRHPASLRRCVRARYRRAGRCSASTTSPSESVRDAELLSGFLHGHHLAG